MTNNYQTPEVFEVGRAQDVVLGSVKDVPILDNSTQESRSFAGDIDENDE
jgi:hypothetical protein